MLTESNYSVTSSAGSLLRGPHPASDAYSSESQVARAWNYHLVTSRGPNMSRHHSLPRRFRGLRALWSEQFACAALPSSANGSANGSASLPPPEPCRCRCLSSVAPSPPHPLDCRFPGFCSICGPSPTKASGESAESEVAARFP
jgi:hypothetical protein